MITLPHSLLLFLLLVFKYCYSLQYISPSVIIIDCGSVSFVNTVICWVNRSVLIAVPPWASGSSLAKWCFPTSIFLFTVWQLRFLETVKPTAWRSLFFPFHLNLLLIVSAVIVIVEGYSYLLLFSEEGHRSSLSWKCSSVVAKFLIVSSVSFCACVHTVILY